MYHENFNWTTKDVLNWKGSGTNLVRRLADDVLVLGFAHVRRAEGARHLNGVARSVSDRAGGWGKEAGLFCGFFLREGKVSAYIGLIQNLKKRKTEGGPRLRSCAACGRGTSSDVEC